MTAVCMQVTVVQNHVMETAQCRSLYPTLPWVLWDKPVNREALAAIHVGTAEQAFANLTPSAAMLSRYGVSTTG